MIAVVGEDNQAADQQQGQARNSVAWPLPIILEPLADLAQRAAYLPAQETGITFLPLHIPIRRTGNRATWIGHSKLPLCLKVCSSKLLADVLISCISFSLKRIPCAVINEQTREEVYRQRKCDRLWPGGARGDHATGGRKIPPANPRYYG